MNVLGMHVLYDTHYFRVAFIPPIPSIYISTIYIDLDIHNLPVNKSGPLRYSRGISHSSVIAGNIPQHVRIM